MELKRYVSPALTLFVLAPIIFMLSAGQVSLTFLLSSIQEFFSHWLIHTNGSPGGYFGPMIILFSCRIILIGSGAILVRELAFRWKKGWMGVLLLGIAYGLINEGLAFKNIYNPIFYWDTIFYGSWMGVNWIWAQGFVILDAVIYVAIPIMLVMLIFPEKKEQPWLGGVTLAIVAALFTSEVAALNIYSTQYSASLSLYALTIIAIVCFIIGARLIRFHPRPMEIGPIRARWYFIFGFLWVLFYGITMNVFPLFRPGIPVVLAIMLAFNALSAFILFRMTGNGFFWGDRQKLALVSGVLGFYILISLAQEWIGEKYAFILGIGLAIFLYWLSRQIDSRENIPPATREPEFDKQGP